MLQQHRFKRSTLSPAAPKPGGALGLPAGCKSYGNNLNFGVALFEAPTFAYTVLNVLH